MNNADFARWCRTAVAGIRYRPDREMVYEELYAHLEDRYEAELERCDSPKEAADAALTAMGSASDIAPQLAAIHRPFWGYVLTAVRWMLWFSVLILVLIMILFPFRYQGSEGYVPWFYQTREVGVIQEFLDGTGASWKVLDIDPDSTDTSDGFRFDVSRAVMICHDDYLYDTNDGYSFEFLIDVTSFWNWSQLHELPIDQFYAVDSLGNVYLAYSDYIQEGQMAVIGNLTRKGPFSYTMELWLSNFRSEDADWIEIRYDREGRDIVLRIDLTGGAW